MHSNEERILKACASCPFAQFTSSQVASTMKLVYNFSPSYREISQELRKLTTKGYLRIVRKGRKNVYRYIGPPVR